jgi:hypothetical protein
VLVRVEGGDVDIHEAHVRVLERGAAGRGEVAVARADADDHVRLGREPVRRGAAGRAHSPEVLRVIPVQRPAAGLGGADRDAGLLDELAQRLLGARINNATARHDERLVRAMNRRESGVQRPPLRRGPADVPLAVAQEFHGHVEGLGLHVLRQRDRDGAGLGRVGQHAQRGQGDRIQLLGTLHPVEEAGERPERVGDLDAEVVREFEPLQHRIGDAGREGVRGQQQRGQPVRGGQRRSGEHVRRARPDRGGCGERGAAAVHAGETDGLVHHRLLVTRLVVGQQRRVRHVGLLERLPESGDVAVAEDAEDPRNRPLPDIAVHGVLVREEFDERLADGHPAGGGHQRAPLLAGR